jgi:hypothetical protein
MWTSLTGWPGMAGLGYVDEHRLGAIMRVSGAGFIAEVGFSKRQLLLGPQRLKIESKGKI